ncbi:MAG: S41 family peptidase [Candidatus Kapaibacteriales bacterium]
MKYLILIIIFLNFFTSKGQLILPHPYNLDFELGDIGSLPKGWIVPRYAEKIGYSAFLTDEQPKKGRLCLKLVFNGEYNEGIYGSVMQSIDAKPFRGKTIRFRAAVKAQIHSPKGSAHLWIRERFNDIDQIGFFEYNPNQPIVLQDWNYYEVIGKISQEAEIINFGLLLFGTGQAWIDDALFEIIEEGQKRLEQPKPLSAHELRNIIQFTNVYGLIRYFYPSESALKIDWDNFALFGLRRLIDISNVDSSRKELLNLFHPIAPLLKIAPKESLNAIAFPKYKEALPQVLLCWRHSVFPSKKITPFVRSEITNIYKPQRNSPASIYQLVPASKFQDSDIRFSIFAKGSIEKPAGRLILMVRFEDTTSSTIASEFKEFVDLDEGSWQKFEITAKVPINTDFIKVNILLVGEGDIYCDSASLNTAYNPDNLLKNPSFEIEKHGLPIFGWRLSESTEPNGYLIKITTKEKLFGEKSLHIKSDKETKIYLPNENDKFFVELDDDYIAVIPAVLQTDSIGTLPHSLINPYESNLQNIEYDYNDRTSKLATLVILKSLIQHFNLYLDPKISLDSLYVEILRETAICESLIKFQRVLQKFLHHIRDNQLRLWNKDLETNLAIPFQFKKFNSKYVITAVSKSAVELDIADEILEINSIPFEKFIDSISIYLTYSNENWKNLKSAVFIRYSPEIDSFKLKVKKKKGKIIELNLKRSTPPSELIETRPDPFDLIAKNTLYIDLTRVNDSKLKEKLDSLPSFQNYVFDLRGFVLTSEHFIGCFVEKPILSPIWKIPIFSVPNKEKISWNIIRSLIKPKNKFLDSKLFFLVDERTVGIGEMIAEIVKTNKLGVLVGTETGGSAAETITIPLPCGFYITMSGIRGYDYSNREIYGRGIQPNFPVFFKDAKEIVITDKILQKVIDLIGN